jgi:trehalose-6-phosphate synthase
MARALLRFCTPDTLFWVHDYHLLPLGLELRDLGVERPIGFFLHTPWPERSSFAAIPHHRELTRAMLAYNLIGFQTDQDRENFVACLKEDRSLTVEDQQSFPSMARAGLRFFRSASTYKPLWIGPRRRQLRPREPACTTACGARSS